MPFTEENASALSNRERGPQRHAPSSFGQTHMFAQSSIRYVRLSDMYDCQPRADGARWHRQPCTGCERVVIGCVQMTLSAASRVRPSARCGRCPGTAVQSRATCVLLPAACDCQLCAGGVPGTVSYVRLSAMYDCQLCTIWQRYQAEARCASLCLLVGIRRIIRALIRS